MTNAGGSPVIDVVGLGPAGVDLVTVGTLELLAGPAPVWLRTARHPAVDQLAARLGDHDARGPGRFETLTNTFDGLYDQSSSLESVYEGIVAELLTQARRHGHVVYAVPGSPVVAERSVELLAAAAEVEVRVHPAMSFLDLAWVRLGLDPVRTGIEVIDGHRFVEQAAGRSGPFLIAQCDDRSVLSDIKLAAEDPPDVEVVILHHLGLPDERVDRVHWNDLDRGPDVDHLTSIHVPALSRPLGAGLSDLAALVAELRRLDPWKAEQTHLSLRRYLEEETRELLDAIESYRPSTGDGAEELCDELGDVLYQVVFHASLAEEAGWFTLGDVVRGIEAKLRFRHPELEDPTAVTDDPVEAQRRWQERKALEGRPGSAESGGGTAGPGFDPADGT
ncbi:MAG: MazG nucleotide pyrophosphohydrolase domain-containing protein [Actinomycetota bacterium]